MKTIAALVAIALVVIVASAASAEVLVRAEKMSSEESATLQYMRNAVAIAQKRLEQCKDIISAAHGMKAEDWVEWSTRIMYDGEYILLYRSDRMSYLPSEEYLYYGQIDNVLIFK